MNEPTYHLDGFDGPLDLLLTLIERHKIDIYNIEITLLLDQYLQWLDEARDANLAVTAEFIDMASRLAYIKSVSLLPVLTEDGEDPKLLLEQMLIEYAKYRRIAGQLGKDYCGDRVFVHETIPEGLPKPPMESGKQADGLYAAYHRLLVRRKALLAPSRAGLTEIVQRVFVSVSDKITHLNRLLLKRTKTTFRSLFASAKSKSEVVATFLALLELLHSGRVTVADTDDPANPDVRLVRRGKENNV